MADTESMNTENSGSDVQEAKWYVAHTYSGYENKVKVNLEKTIANMHLEDTILEVRIPVQEVVETTGTDEGEADKIEYTEEGERKPQKKKKAPKQKLVKRKLFPGYVFVHMILNDDNWYIVRNTRGVTGFVGADSTKPIPLTESEMVSLGVAPQAPSIDFNVGDTVRVTNGVWVNAVGVVDSIDESRQTVKISIPEFMNGTPVGMNVTDITKVK
ncbi:MAG: transcription termination/antitermination protein NusG [Lachnospiraceae bacterium]|uniref:transcription termination/antitermination protein NusG n=1 Tax=Porcincola sp. LCP21S3_C12 TaxID=3438798 RepID=UPI002979A0B2|nr:transcription termination/antitermination protein NusG [Lachnospiraceae bacterium]